MAKSSCRPRTCCNTVSLALLVFSVCCTHVEVVFAQEETPSVSPTPFPRPEAGVDPIPNVPWASEATFELDHSVSDEFSSSSLDLRKWDEHGFRNPDTQCPTWNGPPSTGTDPSLSTFFPAVEHPTKPNKKVRLYRLRDGKLQLRIVKKKLKFFTSREYYCNATTFRCNHDESIRCFATNFFGEPILDSETGDYKAIMHDKCKKTPFCIPHYKYVLGEDERVYTKFASTHLSGKHFFRYGFIETKVRLGNSSAVFAVWMHGRNVTGPGFCRFRRIEGATLGVRRECPNNIKSDRWQEIDLVESMDSFIHGKSFIPNIHVFQGSKGEYTSADAVDDGSGNMGGGPIIINGNNFNSYRNLFNDVPMEERVTNDYHGGFGNIWDLEQRWSEREHVMGVYWSAREIRFYVDGLEVMRLNNTIVHQPMALDVSNKLNVGWSNQTPTAREIKRWGSIDYIRVWGVNTPDGNDPSSTLPLDQRMTRKFKDLYGNKMYGVFNRYPHNDEVTLVAVPPVDPKSGKNPAATAETASDVLRAPLIDVHESEEGRLAWFAPVNGAANYPNRMLVTNDTSVDTWRESVRQQARKKKNKRRRNRKGENEKTVQGQQNHMWRYRPAGGVGHSRYKRKIVKRSAFQRRVAESNPERMAEVTTVNGVRTAEIIENAGVTVYDLDNPNKCWSGTCSRDGSGREIG